MDVATMKKDLENQIGNINKDLKNIYLPHEAVLILLGKRTAFEIALEFIDSLQQEQKPAEGSEDERIRKWLIGYFTRVNKSWIHREFTCEQIIAYLEKQKDHFRIVTKMVEQKPAWSDADNIGWDEAFACVTRAEKAAKNEEELQNAVTAEKWLKEIKFKYYVHHIKQEWSEEDERMRNQLIYDIEHHKKEGLISAKQNKATKALYNGIEKCYDEKIAWLKSLRPQGSKDSLQTHWRPSEEQIYSLGTVVKGAGENSVGSVAYNLKELYEELKKL